MSVEPCGFEFGAFRVDLGERELRRGSQVVDLTAKAFDLLLLLLLRPGRTITKSELLDALWSDTIVEESNLTQTVFMLRKALSEDNDAPNPIVTVPRRGYKFVADVVPIYPQDGNPAPALDPPPHPHSLPARRRWIPLGSVALLLAVAGLAAWSYAKTGWGRSSRIRSIAVLPLRNLTGSPDQDYLAGGMTEVLTTGLGQIGELTVIASSSAKHYEATRLTPAEIARELRVDALVEGSVQRAGNRLVITARLVDGLSERQLWARNFDRDIADLINLQNDVAAALAQEVRLTLTPIGKARLARHRVASPEVQEAYLRALDWHRRGLSQNAPDLLLKAIAKDPDYAAAYAALGDTYGVLTMLRILPQKDAYPKWRGAVTHALELDDSLPEAHQALANLLFFHDWNWSEAEKEYLVSLRLDPNSASAHSNYSGLLDCLGRVDLAVDEAKKSVRLDPLSIGNRHVLAGALLHAKRNDEAIAAGRDLIELGARLSAGENSPDSGAQFAIADGHVMIGRGEQQKGNFQKAIGEFQLPGNIWMPPIMLAHAYALAGKRKEAMQTVAAITNLAQNVAMQVAAFYAAMGDKDKAFEWLDKGYDERPSSISTMKVDPWVDPLRNDPRYAEMLRRMGLPQ